MNKRTLVHNFLKGLPEKEKYPTRLFESSTLLYKFLDFIKDVNIEDEIEVSDVRLILPNAEMQKIDNDAFGKIVVQFGNKIVPVRKMHLTTGSNANPELQLTFAPEYFVLEFKEVEKEILTDDSETT
jgi:hypothetical protein